MDELQRAVADLGALGPEMVVSVAIVIAAVVIGAVVDYTVGRRFDDDYRRYYARKASRYAIAVVGVVALALVWRPFAGQLALLIGIVTAGLALALQDVFVALAGSFNIVSGGIYRVGDRVEVGGVRGDVIDISPLRTTLMEVGPTTAGGLEVHGRQYTGRVVTISNKATFTDPVYNYTAAFEYTWEEIILPIPYDADWATAEAILAEEARAVSATAEASAAIAQMVRRYPLGRADVESRVFVRATDNYLELAARIVVPVRMSRIVKDDVTRKVVRRLDAAGIPVASQTVSVDLQQTNSRSA